MSIRRRCQTSTAKKSQYFLKGDEVLMSVCCQDMGTTFRKSFHKTMWDGPCSTSIDWSQNKSPTCASRNSRCRSVSIPCFAMTATSWETSCRSRMSPLSSSSSEPAGSTSKGDDHKTPTTSTTAIATSPAYKRNNAPTSAATQLETTGLVVQDCIGGHLPGGGV